METNPTETARRWERPEGWDGTWNDIFDEMGWVPSQTKDIVLLPVTPVSETRRIGAAMMLHQYDSPKINGIEFEDEYIVVDENIVTGWDVRYADAVWMFDNVMYVEPRAVEPLT